jgi:hypothetical protein
MSKNVAKNNLEAVYLAAQNAGYRTKHFNEHSWRGTLVRISYYERLVVPERHLGPGEARKLSEAQL